MTKIGLEIHCQITRLNSKLFCGCRADYRSSGPNTNLCPVCMGLPGSLPVLNREAVKKAAMIAMALHCSIPERIAFFRKNYFYPDMPKNFQITQLNVYGETSIGTGGFLDAGGKKIRITRIQLEEDPGRMIYEGTTRENTVALVDYNRAGVPLVEIVTEPDFEDPSQIRRFLNLLSDLLENLGVADPGLEGAMRADANVSVQDGNKVEVKNIGSFYDVEKAIQFELTRQESHYSHDVSVARETRHWDDKRRITVPSRAKEEAMDYRFFLEGDIPWVKIDDAVRGDLKSGMPESISSKKERYVSEYGIQPQVADVLSSDKFYSDLFEAARDGSNEKEVANLITTNLMGLVDTRKERASSRITARHLRDVAGAVMSGRISRNSAKAALHEMVRTGRDFDAVSAEMGLARMSDESELSRIVEQVLADEPTAVEQARSNPQTVNFLVGRVMKKTGGKADPETTLRLIRQKAGL